MRELPPGWVSTTFGEIAELSLGKMLDKKQATGLHPTSYLRNLNVRWGGFNLEDIATMDIGPDELDRVLARPGDVIACEGGEPGRAAVWRGPDNIAVQKALHRIRPAPGVEPDYLAYLLEHQARSGLLAPLFTGSTIKHLPKEKLKSAVVPLAPTDEQRRIVDAVDELLPSVDAADGSLRQAMARLSIFDQASLALAQSDGSEATVGELLDGIEAGKSFKTPGRPAEPDEWGVIKVSAMTWGRFQEEENKAVPQDQEIDPGYEIKPGDLLLSRANTSQYVGATVLVGKCRPHLLLSDKSMRLIPRAGIDRQWFRYALGSPQLRDQMSAVATGTSDSMRNISQTKVRALAIRLPRPERQREQVAQIRELQESWHRLEAELQRAERRSDALRRTVLSAAFSGQLVAQDPTDEPAGELLERIRTEKPAQKRRSKKKVSS